MRSDRAEPNSIWHVARIRTFLRSGLMGYAGKSLDGRLIEIEDSVPSLVDRFLTIYPQFDAFARLTGAFVEPSQQCGDSDAPRSRILEKAYPPPCVDLPDRGRVGDQILDVPYFLPADHAAPHGADKHFGLVQFFLDPARGHDEIGAPQGLVVDFLAHFLNDACLQHFLVAVNDGGYMGSGLETFSIQDRRVRIGADQQDLGGFEDHLGARHRPDG